jgi:hypothetical protein
MIGTGEIRSRLPMIDEQFALEPIEQAVFGGGERTRPNSTPSIPLRLEEPIPLLQNRKPARFRRRRRGAERALLPAQKPTR